MSLKVIRQFLSMLNVPSDILEEIKAIRVLHGLDIFLNLHLTATSLCCSLKACIQLWNSPL